MKKLNENEMKNVKGSACGQLCYCMLAFLDAGSTWEEGWAECHTKLKLPK